MPGFGGRAAHCATPPQSHSLLRLEGLEPTTSDRAGRRSHLLSYRRPDGERYRQGPPVRRQGLVESLSAQPHGTPGRPPVGGGHHLLGTGATAYRSTQRRPDVAKYVLSNPEIIINGVDLSDHINSCSFTETAAEVEATAFGDESMVRLGGLKDGSIDIDWQQDFAAAEVFATLNPLLGTTTTVSVKPTTDATSATNPKKSVTVLVTEVPFVSGAVGELSAFSTSWPFSGDVTTETT